MRKKGLKIRSKCYPDGVTCWECGWDQRYLFRMGNGPLICADCLMENLPEGTRILLP
jgi:hypothetical protein